MSPENIARLERVLEGAWNDDTRCVYGAGLLVYHVWCDAENVPEESRAPAHTHTILTFISALSGGYAGDTIGNYVAGVRAWHILHGLAWTIDPAPYNAALKSAKSLEPPQARRSQRPPCLLSHLKTLHSELNLSTPLHAAVWACVTSLFYGMARSGELTVPNLKAFDGSLHPDISCIIPHQTRHGFAVTIIRLPSTKMSKKDGKSDGEEIFWAAQNDETDPAAALANHIRYNAPVPGEHLFSYTDVKGRRPLSKPKLMNTVNDVLKKHDQHLFGHSFRIGGTLEFLLRGVPFEIVKTKGRWASDSFRKYLRKNGETMAPYIQSQPSVHSQFAQWQFLPAPPAR